MDLVTLAIQLIAGVIGGNAAGAAMKEKSLGGAGNSIAGAIGGIILGQIVQRLTAGAVPADTAAAVATNLDIVSIIKDLVGGGIGGALLAAIGGMIKNR
jgi:hypothetical protein